ncbi:MAG: PspA-associated protein PspAA [Solirubrobacteraceae bacterium]
MIVRIMGEGQYRLDEEAAERVNALDNEAVAAVEGDDEDAFHIAFEQMLELIRTDGEHMNDNELEASDVIVPPADITFVEAAADFTGDGLIPD